VAHRVAQMPRPKAKSNVRLAHFKNRLVTLLAYEKKLPTTKRPMLSPIQMTGTIKITSAHHKNDSQRGLGIWPVRKREPFASPFQRPLLDLHFAL